MKNEEHILERLYFHAEELSHFCADYEQAVAKKETGRLPHLKRLRDNKVQLLNELESILGI